ncbi:cell differentiation protein RCD1 homolog [Prunus yedoensis var. nudiflora]|uniref:Cell differentiation protein RCD1 homolog n=1 Tax=Prunus yedoensis var. nudiflora TaxID=2094558 RepID=A0A314US87_PRUYE|nr:cell differentiation protein RCD1 homolog [Prunus yedoensis var. nudiflora]
MAVITESLLGDQSSSPPPEATSGQNNSESTRRNDADPFKKVNVEQWILELRDRRTRENALQCLSKIREIREDLAPLLWHSFGTTYTLLKEILEVYPMVTSPHLLTQEASNRACNTLSLYQCVAAHPETENLFVKANIPMYIYPFLGTKSKEKPYEYLRLSSLGVIGALVKDNDEDIITFLLQTQVFCYCIRCIEVGTILSRTVATFIIERILISDQGMKYCITFADRFYVITQVLSRMLDKLPEEPSIRLLKLIIHCFLRLSDGLTRDVDSLSLCLPRSLRDSRVINLVSEDPVAMSYLRRLYCNVAAGRKPNGAAGKQPNGASGAESNGRVAKG